MTIILTPHSAKLLTATDTETGKVTEVNFFQVLPFAEKTLIVSTGLKTHAASVAADVTPLVVTPPAPVESAHGTTITAPGGAPIIDTEGVAWNLAASPTQGNVITADGVAVSGTNNVTQLVYADSCLWQQAFALWWGKATLAAPWTPTAGTATGPLDPVVPPVIVPLAGITSPVDMSGWKLVWHDDFPGTSLSADWRKYGTGKSGSPPIMFNNDGIGVDNGFKGKIWKDASGQWYGPGLNTVQGFSAPYRIEVRANVPKAAGVAPYFLMWPTNDQWPPEIDAAEYPNNSESVMLTLHDMTNDNGGYSDFFAVDRSTWHTLTMELSATGIRRWINGVEKPSNAVWNAHNNINIPMSPGIGAVAFPPGSGGAGWFGSTDGTTPNPYYFQVAYWAVYKPA